MPIFQAIHAATSKDQMKQFDQANYLLGHFCRATGYDPSGSVTEHLTQLMNLIESGCNAHELHQAIDTYADNLPANPRSKFNDFIHTYKL